MYKVILVVVLAVLAIVTKAVPPSAPFIGIREDWKTPDCSGPSSAVHALVTGVCFPVSSAPGKLSKKYYYNTTTTVFGYNYYTDANCQSQPQPNPMMPVTDRCIAGEGSSFRLSSVTNEKDLYNKYSDRNFYITYGYGFDNCAGSSPTNIYLNFMEGCVPQTDNGKANGKYSTYTFTATGVIVKEYTDNACTGSFTTTTLTYNDIGFNKCNPNEDEDAKSTLSTSTFLLVPTQIPTRAPTYAPGKPTPRPTVAPTIQIFPYVLTENFLSTNCAGPVAQAHVDVTGICDISYTWTQIPGNPDHYDKTRNPGSFKRSAEGANRYRQEFSDDNCQTSKGSKHDDGPLGQCISVTSSDPKNPVKSTKLTGITKIDDLPKKYPGYVAYADYLGDNCDGSLVSLSLQDQTKTCWSNTGADAIAPYGKTTCDYNSFYSEAYSDATCTKQVVKYPYQQESCRKKSLEEISSVAKSSKTTCNVLPGPPSKSPTSAPTLKPTSAPTLKPTLFPTKAFPTKAFPTKAPTAFPTQTKAPPKPNRGPPGASS